MEKVNSQITALVIGTGGFGRYYAQILSRLNCEKIQRLPVIKKLIVTRTQLEKAKALADLIRNHENCFTKEVIGFELNNTRQLLHLVEQNHPEFIAIAARDKKLGDEIHAIYTQHALKCGAVLCEKPFSNATGDGSSLRYFNSLFGYENSDLFGLELPFYIVKQEIMKNKKLREIFMSTRHFEFYWETLFSLKNYIINDLVLHPWSLIPEQYRIESTNVIAAGNTARVNLQLFNTHTSTHATCKINLREGGTFRGMKLDNYSIAVRIDGDFITLIETNGRFEDVIRNGSNTIKGNKLLEVNNPLKQHIIAVLRRDPIVQLKKTYDSQLFLETLHGYTSL